MGLRVRSWPTRTSSSDRWPILGGADVATVVARVLTLVYFLFFLLMPWYTARDRTKPVPDRVQW